MSESANKSPNDQRILRMDAKTARSLSSGQVITSLTNVVKELLENAIDAKATVITIRLKEMGKELIEVTDNGFGISQKDFTSVAKRNCTSKLDDFESLSSINSFGFRGEALNSLCNLSEVSIKTRHLNDLIGTHLKLDSDANIISEELMPRTVGTTVSVHNLFHCIPVRKKDFLTNIKREFDKMVRLVYSYCIGSIGLRINLTNQMPNKANQTIISSPGLSIRHNIIEVFDVKQFNNLIEFKQNTQSFEELNSDPVIEISGFISKCDSGCGRSASDRQFFYVNKRPSDMKNISKFMNEIYRSFNRSQYPFLIINISIDKNFVDFNLTPDKRQILIQFEDKIFILIKESLHKLFNKQSTCQLNSMANYTTKGMSQSQNSFLPIQQIKRRQLEDEEVAVVMHSPLKIVRSHSPCDSPFKATTTRDSLSIPEDRIIERSAQFNWEPKSFSSALKVINDKTIKRPKIQNFIDSESNQNHSNYIPNPETKRFEKIPEDISFSVKDVSFHSSENSSFQTKENTELDTTERVVSEINKSKSLTEIEIVFDSDEEFEQNNNSNDNQQKETNVLTDDLANTQTTVTSIIQINDQKSDQTNDIEVDISCEQINSLFVKSKDTEMPAIEQKFSAKISASQNHRAEQELIHELNKKSFERMKIVGQFNMGFILTKEESDLFIVDQHASDERFNYETLMANTPIENQRLVRPMPLELSAANEMVVIDHLDVFKKLGFNIVVNEEAVPGHRIHLSSIPISKEWTGGKEDIEEIVGKIIDTPIELMKGYKLDSLKKVVASRACRSSVMIGTSQTNSQMKTIVSHMSELNNPWHCAHNRPTIRHLVNMRDISSLSQIE